MFPSLSTDRLPIQRFDPSSGPWVPVWKTDGEPPGSRISAQRMPARFAPRLTVLLAHTASWSPKLRYTSRFIVKKLRTSSSSGEPGCGTHGLKPHRLMSISAVGTVAGPVKVELPGSVQSTWNCHTLYESWPATGVVLNASSSKDITK